MQNRVRCKLTKTVCHPRYAQIPLAPALTLTHLDCLTKSNYNEAKCQDVIKALYACCESFYARYGDEASSPSCPKPSLLRLKMKQVNEGK